ncbi:MAG: preprotein translocase subunit SecY [Alphaproteobacteria bacterium]
MSRIAFGSQAEVADLLTRAKDLQGRVLFVLFAFIVYRLGTHIPLPGIDAGALAQYQTTLQQGIFGLFNMFSGGAFSRMAIFALNIMPYITASIIIQLMASAYPALQELKKEGEVGRRKLTQYTKYLAVLLAFVQGYGLATGIEFQTVNIGSEVTRLVLEPGMLFRLQTALTIMTGTMFLMWLGEQINVKGIGNGISLLIFAGIAAEMPAMIAQMIELSRTGAMSGLTVAAILIGMVAMVFAIVFMETAQRRLTIQYPKRQTAQGSVMSEANHLPLKVNMAGVIPPIFASALLMAPVTAASFAPNSAWAQFVGVWMSPGKPVYLALFVALIVFFCFFYTATVAFNAEETAENLKKNGGFIPGIRPGAATAVHLDNVVTRLTVIGAAYLAVLCAVPDVLHAQQAIPMYIGGTSLLIMVSVTIDTVSRIQSALIVQKYESLLKKSALRGRRKV